MAAFGFDPTTSAWHPLPGGHIHDSFVVADGGPRAVLQRLNRDVFTDLGTLISNVARVVAHLRARGLVAPRLLSDTRGATLVDGADSGTWRAFAFLEGTVGRTAGERERGAFEAARAYGRFASALRDLPEPPLAPTIPRFHDLRRRLDDLETAARAAEGGRAPAVRAEVSRARSVAASVVEGLDREAARRGPLPVRTVHNDAKLGNVRFSASTGRAVCVVDFDTTMAGAVLCDVGELLRSAATHTPEDDPDPGRVDLDLRLVDAVGAGYRAGAGDLLDPSEVAALGWSGPWMAAESALRFLTDHLGGDSYFRIEREGQNLDRARVQLRLAELMLDATGDLQEILAAPWRGGSTR